MEAWCHGFWYPLINGQLRVCPDLAATDPLGSKFIQTSISMYKSDMKQHIRVHGPHLRPTSNLNLEVPASLMFKYGRVG